MIECGQLENRLVNDFSDDEENYDEEKYDNILVVDVIKFEYLRPYEEDEFPAVVEPR